MVPKSFASITYDIIPHSSIKTTLFARSDLSCSDGPGNTALLFPGPLRLHSMDKIKSGCLIFFQSLYYRAFSEDYVPLHQHVSMTAYNVYEQALRSPRLPCYPISKKLPQLPIVTPSSLLLISSYVGQLFWLCLTELIST